MIKFHVIDTKRKNEFDKEFDSPYKARCFRIKCYYSNHLHITSMEADSQEELNEILW